MAVELAASSLAAREREKRARLSHQPLLAGCSPMTLRRISAVADEITAQPGEVLIQQGRHVFWFFLIQRGQADVVRDGHTVAQLRPGEYFGETVLVHGGTQPATVVATTTMRLFVIGSQRFVPLAHDIRQLRRRLDVPPVRRRARLPRPRRAFRRAPSPPRRLVVVPPPDPRRRRRRALPAAIVAVGALTVALEFHPPFAVVSAGPAFDVAKDITISGAPVSAPRGRYLLTSVTTSRPNALGLLVASLRTNHQIVSARGVASGGHRRVVARRREAALFQQSRVVAAAAAARALGLHVGLSGTGARVVDAGFGLQGTQGLDAGDVIVAMEEPQATSVDTATGLLDVIESRPAGTPYRLVVERAGVRRTVSLTSGVDNGRAGLVGLSLATRDLAVQLPFDIHFRDRDIVGPSAGLAYALAVADMLSADDVAHGRSVAATGEVEPDGTVRSVAYLPEKAAAAHRAGARVFVVPGAQAYAADGHAMKIDGVSSLDEALADLHG